MELAEGKVIAGRYRLDRRIGAGGMGEVWAATQMVTRRPVALKFLKEEGASNDEVRRRFLREARAAGAVRHPNVVQIHDVLEVEGGAPVMVMELLEGESLEQRLRREGRMTLGDLAAVMLRVVSAVGTAHALGIVHRDLKPDNIFLVQTPEGLEIKVLDFGIAKLTALEGNAAETGGLTNTGAMLGTPYYMSPEQAFGEKRIDHRADVWSLGIILYRALSGVLPTQAENIGQILKIIMTHAIPPLRELVPDLPPDVLDLVARMLEADPKKRPQDLQEVKAVLERYAGVVVEAFGTPSAAPSASEPPRTGHDGAASGPIPRALARAEVTGGASQARVTGGTASTVSATPAPVSGKGKVVVIASGVIVAGAVASLLFVRPRAPAGTDHAPPTASTLAAPAPPPPTSAPSASVEAPPTASASATVVPVATVTSAQPSASTTAPRRLGKGPAGAATAAEGPKDPGKPSMGGVIEKPPF